KQVSRPGSDRDNGRRQQTLGFENIGPPTQEIDGKPNRRPGRQLRNRTASPQFPGDRLRIFSDQNGDRIAVGRDQRLQGLDICAQSLDLAFCKQHIQFVGEPAIQPGLGEIENFARGFNVAVKDLKALLPRPQIEVQSGDVCGDYDINPIASLQERLGGIDLRLETSRDLAENVDLPLGIETADLADLLQALSVSSVPQRLR